jgi:hypothetical protein
MAGPRTVEQPGLAVQLSERIPATVLQEQSTTDQLIFPLVEAIGRRTVLQRLAEALAPPIPKGSPGASAM